MGDRTFKLGAGIKFEYGRSVKSLWSPVTGKGWTRAGQGLDITLCKSAETTPR